MKDVYKRQVVILIFHQFRQQILQFCFMSQQFQRTVGTDFRTFPATGAFSSVDPMPLFLSLIHI